MMCQWTSQQRQQLVMKPAIEWLMNRWPNNSFEASSTLGFSGSTSGPDSAASFFASFEAKGWTSVAEGGKAPFPTTNISQKRIINTNRHFAPMEVYRSKRPALFTVESSSKDSDLAGMQVARCIKIIKSCIDEGHREVEPSIIWACTFIVCSSFQ